MEPAATAPCTPSSNPTGSMASGSRVRAPRGTKHAPPERTARTILSSTLTALGRADEFLVAAARAAISTRWLEAGTAYARGQMEKAADICAVIGVLPNE